jgi:(p)ppGpp synthase/HD superfamily hydrolase
MVLETYDTMATPRIHSVAAMHGTAVSYLYVVAPETVVAGEAFAVRLVVNAEDRRGLYADIMQAISSTGTNIRGADLNTRDGSVFGTIFVEVDNLPHLEKVLRIIRRVKGVHLVDRHEEGQPPPRAG